MTNFYSQFLWNFPIENFSFIGIVEHFDDDISYFSKQFLNIKDPVIPRTNANPKKEKTYVQDPAMIKRLQTHHAKDYEMYQYALNKREMR